ncbi:MAG: Lar family restriction alleviation protein [Synergistaceae bacterium]|nr:Lar family restriction alleviation protein [Synergistaceae bacterium]
MSELKRCPFCGGKASVRQITPLTGGTSREFGYGGYFVMCDWCMTSSNNYSTEQVAADHWNRRVLDES